MKIGHHANIFEKIIQHLTNRHEQNLPLCLPTSMAPILARGLRKATRPRARSSQSPTNVQGLREATQPRAKTQEDP